MKKPDLWMPWYIGDYLADTTHLSNAEHGSYMLMLAHAWMNKGLLPLDENRLCRLAHMTREDWAESRDVIMDFWTATENGYTQTRLSKELEKAKNMQQQRIDAGKASAEARWGNERINGKGNGKVTSAITTVATRPERENTPSPSPSPSPPRSSKARHRTKQGTPVINSRART